MNKKVLTLCAGLILAGSFGSINALGLEKAVELNGNSGKVVGPKYYYLDRVAQTTSLSPTVWEKKSDNFYLKAAGEEFYYVNVAKEEGDETIYWKVEEDHKSPQGVWYKLTTQDDKQLVVEYTNASGEVVEIKSFLTSYDADGINSSEEVSSLYFYDENNDVVYVNITGTGTTTDPYKVSTSSIQAQGFALREIPEYPINAADLNAKEKDSFHLNFKGYDSLEGNVFEGALRAIPARGEGKHANSYYLYNVDKGEYIVLTKDVWSATTANLDGKERSAYQGYKFTTVSEHAWETTYNNTEKRNQVAKFQILKSYDFNNTDSLIVTMPDAYVEGMPTTWNGEQLDGTYDEKGENNYYKGVRLFVSTVNDINYLTVIEYAKANDRLAEQQDDAYEGKNGVPYEVGASAPYIEFGEGTQITNIGKAFAGKLWNITTLDGSMIMSPEVFTAADIDGEAGISQLFAPAAQIDLTNPEGQWLLNQDETGYYFVNRESGAKWPVSFSGNEGWIMRKGEVADVYEVCWKHQMITSKWQSIIIKEAGEPGKTENGYVNFDMAKEANNGKYMSFETSLGVTAYIGKDADDNVILTPDASQAIEFRVKQLSHDFTDHDGEIAPDTLQHYTTYLDFDKDGNIVTNVDTLQFFQYALYENFSEKYLKYDEVTKKFVLSDEYNWDVAGNGHENFDLNAADYAFVVKEKEDGSYILVREYAIDYDYCVVDRWKNHTIGTSWTGDQDYTFDNIFEVNFGDNAYKKTAKNEAVTRNNDANGDAHKAYAATLPGTLADMEALYNFTDNDRITMANTDKVEYLSITGAQDTVKIALQDQPNFFLYEQKGFLGMEHVADVEDMKAAIFVDTAYVRNETYRPQFLLAMGGRYVPEHWDNHPESEQQIPPHLITPDTTYGRFLVNMVDSAVTYKGSDKTNPYIFDRNDYYRLAFIDGYHTGDTLYLNTANKTKIALDDNNDKVCTFAFRYVDNSRTGVKIETRYNTTADDVPVRGWLKYQNNVAVVTNDYNDAHVFTVDNTTLEAPTANEEITAEGAVSVVATDGAVIIKGAEGKNVVIATILGKVVANETVNSDNETIAVPAGIAVVSVDGESFKVVVK